MAKINNLNIGKILSVPLILFGSTVCMYEVALLVLTAIPYDLSSGTAAIDDYIALTILIVSLAICLYIEICITHYCLSLSHALIFSYFQFACASLFLVNEFFYLTNPWYIVIFIFEAILIFSAIWSISHKYSKLFKWATVPIFVGFFILCLCVFVYAMSIW